MLRSTTFALAAGLAALALAGCEQNTTVPEDEVDEEVVTDTEVVPVPGPTATETVTAEPDNPDQGTEFEVGPDGVRLRDDNTNVEVNTGPDPSAKVETD